ncbi:MAG: GntR family transcriptional regulator [Hyphomicrobiales bacterium]|nr:GntR family transcriptional regulator [Hyphomicrobiales bacterium]
MNDATGPRSAPLTVARRVEEALRRAIVTLELPPGTALSENDLAERFHVSRQPIREALIALSHRGLVEIQPRRGTTVIRISADQMRQVRFIRESLEVSIARAAVQFFDPAVRRRIELCLEAQDRHAAAVDIDAFRREDEAFHAALAEGAGYPSAWQLIDDVKAHMDRVCHLTLPIPDTLPLLARQHRAIIAAIDAGDADAAEAATRTHLAHILEALPQVEANFAHLFS